MEAAIKTRLLLGQEKTEQAKPILFKEWATAYLNLESITTLRSYQDRLEIVERQLILFFGGKVLTEIRPHEVEAAEHNARETREARPVFRPRTMTILCSSIASLNGTRVSVQLTATEGFSYGIQNSPDRGRLK